MNSYREVRRIRAEMSERAGHDVRRLIAMINERRSQCRERLIDPGTAAEHCDLPEGPSAPASEEEGAPATR